MGWLDISGHPIPKLQGSSAANMIAIASPRLRYRSDSTAAIQGMSGLGEQPPNSTFSLSFQVWVKLLVQERT